MDVFGKEQQVYDETQRRIKSVREGGVYDFTEFEDLAYEYGVLLVQIRRISKISDKTTSGLNLNRLMLLEKLHYDELTGVYSRQFMKENLRRLIRLLSRSAAFLSVLMIDIDFFKNYNDNYGHDMGDKCLRAVAETLRTSLMRSDDFVARYGGEEFLVVLPNADKAGAIHVANKLLKDVRKLNITHGKSEVAPYVTISIGITSNRVQHEQKSSDYIKIADQALYKSKNNGRNQCTFIEFTEEQSNVSKYA
ncbi:MAG: GGDEF domain-containing protein [Sporomusaceae bacterium]|jgi:diguanylate cyclase (GGDEF)-like protein|nr:GGDEF domain-containing protein [Sporomusaceae bacterium]